MEMGAPVLAMASQGMPTPHDATEGRCISRMTKNGRTLWYNIKVIQQPERARACGSGPKSSADRRPVDPPPVVELRIYEGATWEQAKDKDITFLYNANFFLFATLEHSRAMAHGRVQTPAPNTPPVLTGMPVSGMAYLDRPQEAGYFLFPDLSVRHEGWYKLTFNLYEETKEDNDKDPDLADSQLSVPGLSAAMGGSFDFRMEIKSNQFLVFSAKKFPGLTESTPLSRVVAEQGCRVRIRRDVRMRRRDPKGASNGSGGGGGGSATGSGSGSGSGNSSRREEGEDEYGNRRRTPTPDTLRQDPFRGRSMSGSTDRPPYTADAQRRPSVADYPPQYASQPPSAGGHLQFLSAHTSQYPAQPQYQRPPSVPASPVYTSGQGPPYHGQAPSYPPPSAPAPYSTERTPQAYMPILANPIRRDSALDQEYRSTLPSAGSVILPPLGALPPHAQAYQHMAPTASHLPMTPHKSPRALPPLQVDTRVAAPGRLPMLSPSLTAPRTSGSYSSSTGSTFSRPMPSQHAGTKRAHDETFREDFEPPRFQNGARESGIVEDKDDGPLLYKRADGSMQRATAGEYIGLYDTPRPPRG